MALDDFMFNAVEGGGFVNDPAINDEGLQLLFEGSALIAVPDLGVSTGFEPL